MRAACIFIGAFWLSTAAAALTDPQHRVLPKQKQTSKCRGSKCSTKKGSGSGKAPFFAATLPPTFSPTTNAPSIASSSPSTFPTAIAATATPASPPVDQLFSFMQCETKEDCCQGLDGLCDLRLDQILLAGAHNSFASIDKGFLVPNHKLETKLSLDAGFRDIGVDMCNCNGQYVLCHGYCQLGQLPSVEYFGEIVAFLNNNPSEIIVINMEINSGADQEVTLDGIYNVLTQVNGMTDMLYQHGNPADEWPTLRTLRDAGKRIVLFHYNGANCDADDCPVGMNYYWDHAVDTQYSFRNLEELEDSTSSCNIIRGADRGSNHFFAVNSFVTPSSQSTSETINSRDFANRRIDTCSSANRNRTVTTYYVDFWSLGEVPQMVQARNAALAQQRAKQRRHGIR